MLWKTVGLELNRMGLWIPTWPLPPLLLKKYRQFLMRHRISSRLFSLSFRSLYSSFQTYLISTHTTHSEGQGSLAWSSSSWGHRVGHNLVTEWPPPISGGQLFSWKMGQWIKRTGYTNNPMLKEINPEYTLEGLMLKLKLQNFDYLIPRADSLEKTLVLGNIEGRRSRGWQRMRWLDGIIDSMDMSLSKLQETVKDSKDWHATIHGVTKSPTKLSDWTTTHYFKFCFLFLDVLPHSPSNLLIILNGLLLTHTFNLNC